MPNPSPISLVPTAIRPPPINLGEPAAFVGGCDRGFRARNRVDQGLNFVGRALVAKETQDNADGFFSHSTIDAGLCGQLSYQFVHIAPPSTGCLPVPCL